MARHSEAVDPSTVWTWNAIGKAESAWSLSSDADESKKGFLLNHLITDELPMGKFTVSNSDPITGQAGWYDVKVKIFPSSENEPEETWPQIKAYPVPGMSSKSKVTK
jgi:hypothetical protein